MGVLGRIQETLYRATGRAELAQVVRQERLMVEHLTESLSDLEQQMHEPGWNRLTAEGDQEFTRDGLKQITAVCRIMALKNPLIKRGLSLRQAYVWGSGVEISARDPKVNDAVQRCIDENQTTFFGPQAQEELDRAVGTDGNVFVALFTDPLSGQVKIRTLPWDQITNVISNPEDSQEIWYYRREWWIENTDLRSGGVITSRRSAYYPALGYRPRARPSSLNQPIYGDAGEAHVYWDAPVYHVKIGGHLHWKWGVPDVYAAVDWALAYKDFLTDWATLIKSLSRFAWRLTSPGSKQAQAKAKLSAAPSTDPLTGEFKHAGATAIQSPGQMLEAIPKSGATIDSESGRPLAAMVAAALDLPVTMLLGDPGLTGARATAETLDRPTELSMEQRRNVWGQAINAILQYVIAESVRAPSGSLRGRLLSDDRGLEIVRLPGKRDTTIDISWPDLDETDPEVLVNAIAKADGTGNVPRLIIARLLLEALGVQDVDQILEKLTGPDGEFVSPDSSPGLVPAGPVGGPVPPPGTSSGPELFPPL